MVLAFHAVDRRLATEGRTPRIPSLISIAMKFWFGWSNRLAF
jgi:hypothetical protein